ncbi:hypothetical protein B0H13DRAFT_2051324 [Mycena leptocephala]|nr:hypothetical protein B0H13DRAFT_2051324 [Mycena leptocephala]
MTVCKTASRTLEYVAYRGYERKNVAPLFSFEHGLPYSTFEYSSLQVSAVSRIRSDVQSRTPAPSREGSFRRYTSLMRSPPCLDQSRN